jgi:lipoate-protein ligase A
MTAAIGAQDLLRRASAGDQMDWIAAALAQPIGAPAISVWAYTAPAVVLGRSQRLTPEIAQRAATAGVPVRSSPAGGSAVLAGPWMLGAAVLLPPGHPSIGPSIPQSFRWFGVAHAAWLRRHGVDAMASPAPAPAQPGDEELDWACFASVSRWEVVAGSGKIVGLAQARRRNGVLLMSAVLLQPPPWALLCNVMDKPLSHAAVLACKTSSCARMRGQAIDPATLVQALRKALGEQLVTQELRAA